MGAPTFSILSETYLQNVENPKIFDILRSSRIAGYFILIIYNEKYTHRSGSVVLQQHNSRFKLYFGT
jgi:hypothetical protein